MDDHNTSIWITTSGQWPYALKEANPEAGNLLRKEGTELVACLAESNVLFNQTGRDPYGGQTKEIH